MSQPLVIIVILNTNRRDDTLECLTSLKESTYENYKIMVLDNHSTDGSVEAISTSHPDVEIVHLDKNLGYAGNNNVGVEIALDQQADWVFVLNEDTILDPECLSRLVQVGESGSSIGIVGPMVYHHDEPSIIQSAGGRLNNVWHGFHIGENEPDRGQFNQPHKVEWISGCAILLRRELIEKVGALDERFFYYWEETEWCVRAGRGGWAIMHVPAAKIWHKGVQLNYEPKPSVTYYNTRNKLLMLHKHHAPFKARMFTWFQIMRTLVSWSVRPKWRMKSDHRNAMWHGMWDFIHQRWGQMPSRTAS